MPFAGSLQAAGGAWISKDCMMCRKTDSYLGCLVIIISPAHTLDIFCHLCQHLACINASELRLLPDVCNIQTTRLSLTWSLSAVNAGCSQQYMGIYCSRRRSRGDCLLHSTQVLPMPPPKKSLCCLCMSRCC